MMPRHLAQSDRSSSPEEAMRPAYEALVLRLMSEGWSEAKIVLAIENLAQEHIGALASDEAAGMEMREARAGADLRAAAEQERMFDDIPKPPSAWPWALTGAILAAAAIGLVRWIG